MTKILRKYVKQYLSSLYQRRRKRNAVSLHLPTYTTMPLPAILAFLAFLPFRPIIAPSSAAHYLPPAGYDDTAQTRPPCLPHSRLFRRATTSAAPHTDAPLPTLRPATGGRGRCADTKRAAQHHCAPATCSLPPCYCDTHCSLSVNIYALLTSIPVWADSILYWLCFFTKERRRAEGGGRKEKGGVSAANMA